MAKEEFLSISAKDMVVGEPLRDAVYNSDGVLLLRKGFVIRTQDMVSRLLSGGAYRKKTVRPAASDAASLPDARPDHVFELVSQVEATLSRVLKRTPGSLIVETMQRQTARLQKAVKTDTDAAIAAVLLPSETPYSVKHPINVAIIADIVLSAMGVDEAERGSIMAAALTMNLGMQDIQDALTHQQAPLSDAQRRAIQDHPAIGHRLLAEAGVADPSWLDAVLHHHEFLDGSGYPDKLAGEQLGLGSRLLSILDIFCARISPRGYRPGLLPNQAMAEIFISRGSKYDQEIPAFLIQELGIYPPGTVVELANGETAIVAARGSVAQFPMVTALLNPQGHRLNAPIRRDTRSPDYSIVKQAFLHNSDVTINRFQLWSRD